MESKDEKNSGAKVAEATAGLEKLNISKKKKFKFVKVDPKELNIVIDDGRGRDTDFRNNNNNKPNHVKSQESRKASSHHQDKGAGSSSRHSNPTGGPAPSRNMSRGSGKHPSSSSNYKADFEVNEDSGQQHKKHKRESSKVNATAISQQNSNDKEFKNNLMWEGDANAKKSRNQWKNLEVNNPTNKTRERLMSKPLPLMNESADVDSRTTTASVIDTSLYQNTYDSKTRNFVDGGNQIFNTASNINDTTEHSAREDKLFSNEALYAPSSTPNYSYPSSSVPTYAAMTTASGNSNSAATSTGPANNVGVYSTNSFMAATTHGYSSITNTQPSQQQSNSSVYSSINSYSSFPQQTSSSYGHDESPLSNSNNNYSAQNLYQPQPSSGTYTSYPQTSVANSIIASSKYSSYGVDMKNHLDSKSTLETKTSVEHPPYVDYPSYMGTQYQDSLLKDVKAASDPVGHFEFRNTLDIAPMIPMDSYMTNYMQPGPPPQSTSDYKMLYWNNMPMPNLLHAPPPQPPHSAMYKYYDMPTSQAAQKPFMKLNDSTASDTSAYMSPTHMRLHTHTHQIPGHRYPMDSTSTNKMPLAYSEPQAANLQSSLNEYQRYQNERHHFTDFGNFQAQQPLANSLQHNYQTSDAFGNSDLPTRIHQQATSVHPYFSSSEDSVAQRYGAPDANARNKRAITGGTNPLPHRVPHYPRHPEDLAKPPVPHTSGNIFVNHNKYEPQYPLPNVLSSNDKLRKPNSTVVTSIITSTATTNVSTAPPALAKPVEPSEKLPSEPQHKEPDNGNAKKNIKSPAKSNPSSQPPNEKIHKGGDRDRQRDRGDNGRHQQQPMQYQNNMIKTINFNQFQNNVMRNHPGHNKNFRSHNKSFGDNKNKEFKVTKIMQRPVDENKDEIAKLPIPLGVNKTEEKKSDDKKVEDEKSKDSKTAKPPTTSANKKTTKQQNIQILSPTKKTNKEEDKKTEKAETNKKMKTEKEETNKSVKQTDEKSKDNSKDDKENKSDDKSKLSNSKDTAKPNKKDESIKENKQQRRKFNNNFNNYGPKYPRHPYNGEFHYLPVYDGNMNKFNKFNGGNSRYPQPRYYDFDMIDPRSCFFPGGPPYQYGGGGPPMYNNLYNGNNYSNNKKKQSNNDKKQDVASTEETKSKKQQQTAEESKKASNKKIKFKGTEILTEPSTSSGSAASSPVTPAVPVTSTADNSNNPSSILKKSKTNEDCKVKNVQEASKPGKNQTKAEDLDEREPSTIQLFMGLDLDKKAASKKPLVYPLKTFDMDIDDMTSREIFEDVYADIKTHQSTYKDKQLMACFYNSIVNNSHLFKDRVVLEIGCGMGLLSLFCAEAGARHVISVDCSVITQLTEELVEENDLDDVITVIRGRMEDVTKLPHGIRYVDIIVANWMGHSLYLDSIINAVLYARGRFLIPGGLILPDRAELYCVGANDTLAANKFLYWQNVYGFDMEPIQRDWPNIAKFHSVPEDKLMTDPVLIHSIDLNTCTVADTNFGLEFTMITSQSGFVNSFVLYFKTFFLDSSFILDTSPYSPSTHWAQTVLFIDKGIMVREEAELLCNLELIRLRDRQNSVQCNVSMDYLGYATSFFEKKYILSFY